MVSLDLELSKLSILLMSTSATFGSQNGSTFSKFPKQKLEISFLQHESKIEDSLRFFPDKFKKKNGIKKEAREVALNETLSISNIIVIFRRYNMKKNQY